MRHIFPLISVAATVACLGAWPANASAVRSSCHPFDAQSAYASCDCRGTQTIASRTAPQIAQADETPEERRLRKERRAERKALRELKRLERQQKTQPARNYDPSGNGGLSQGGG